MHSTSGISHLALVAVLLSAVAAQAQQAEPAGDKEIFEARFGQAWREATASADKTDDLKLARRILKAAKATQDEGLRVGLALKSHLLFLRDPRGYAPGLGAAELVRQSPAMRKVGEDMTLITLERMMQVRDPQQRMAARKTYAIELMKIGDRRLLDAEVLEAVGLYAKAQPLASVMTEGHRQELSQRIRTAQRLRADLARASQLQETIGQGEGDVRSTIRELVLLYLVELNRPDLALRYVGADYWDPYLRTYVPLAARPVQQVAPKACLELARWYEAIGSRGSQLGQALTQTRALQYYQRYIEEAGENAPAQVLQSRDALRQKVQEQPALVRELAGLKRGGPEADPNLLEKGPLPDARAVEAQEVLSNSRARPRERRRAFELLRDHYSQFDVVRQTLIKACRRAGPAEQEKYEWLGFLYGRYRADEDVIRLARDVAVSQAPPILRMVSLDFLFQLPPDQMAREDLIRLADSKLGGEKSVPPEREKSLRYLGSVMPQNENLAEVSARIALSDKATEPLRLAALNYLIGYQAKKETVTQILIRVTQQQFSGVSERLAALGALASQEPNEKIQKAFVEVLESRWLQETERMVAIEALSSMLDQPTVVEALKTASQDAWRSDLERSAVSEALKASDKPAAGP